jgi:hypothetical protein
VHTYSSPPYIHITKGEKEAREGLKTNRVDVDLNQKNYKKAIFAGLRSYGTLYVERVRIQLTTSLRTYPGFLCSVAAL